MAENAPAAEAQLYLIKAGRLLKQNEWREDGQSKYLLSCAQVMALLDLAAAIRADEPDVDASEEGAFDEGGLADDDDDF
jgi:hypothetical protein